MSWLGRIGIATWLVTIGALATQAVLHADSRLGALFAVVAGTGGPLYAARRLGEDHADDPVPPSLWARLAEVFDRAAGLARVGTILFAAVVVRGDGYGPVFAVVASMALVSMLVSAVEQATRRVGIERDVHLRSASIAFVVTMLCAGVLTCFESLGGVEAQPMAPLFLIGLGTWLGTAIVLTRRAT